MDGSDQPDLTETTKTPMEERAGTTEEALEKMALLEKNVGVDYATIDHRGNLKIVAIMNFFQNAASEHAAQIGVSGFDLAKENLGWVIHRYHIQINRSAKWLTPLSIKTFRSPHRNLYDVRFLTLSMAHPPMDDKRGCFASPIAQAKASWIMINKKNGKPVRLSKYMSREMITPPPFSRIDRQCCAIGYEYDMSYAQKSWHHETERGDDTPLFGFPDIPLPERIDFELPFKVRMHDLDLNGHVNNAIFVEWAVESVPERVLDAFTPQIIDVVFQKEALYGDTILSKTELRSCPFLSPIADDAPIEDEPTAKNEAEIEDKSTAKNEAEIEDEPTAKNEAEIEDKSTAKNEAEIEDNSTAKNVKENAPLTIKTRHLITRTRDQAELARLTIQWRSVERNKGS